MSTDLARAIDCVRAELGAAPLMRLLAGLVMVSEAWMESDRAHLVAWVPDINGDEIAYTRKHIVLEDCKIISMRAESSDQDL